MLLTVAENVTGHSGKGSSLAYALGFLCGFLLIVAIKLVPDMIARRKGKKVEKKYDERQILARGKAYKASFLITIAIIIIDGYMMERGNMVLASMAGQILLMLIGVAIFATICIANDAYMTIKEQPKAFNISGIIILVMNLVFSYDLLAGKANWLEDGRLSTDTTNFMCAITFLIILAVYNVKRLMDRDEE